MKEKGTLYIVATPIGNLQDITLRALETLRTCDLICAEDTRQAKKLLSKYEIATPISSFHAHSSSSSLNKIITQLGQGKSVSLISDAGTPGISDPGFLLVRAALAQGIAVVPLPGASAVITALSASGLPSDKFVYLGFLPLKKGRQTLFASLQEEKRTVVFYESPHRILKTISQLQVALGEGREVVLARELTKIFEEFWRGTLSEAAQHLQENKPKGEFVVLLAPPDFKHAR